MGPATMKPEIAIPNAATSRAPVVTNGRFDRLTNPSSRK